MNEILLYKFGICITIFHSYKLADKIQFISDSSDDLIKL